MVRFKITKRQDAGSWMSCLVLFSAVTLSLFLSAILLAIQGKPPVAGLQTLLTGAFGSLYALEDCIIKAVPIFLCSIGVAIAFRLEIWNIGAEGQYALGAVGATWVALSLPELPWFLLIPFMMLAAFVFGAVWGAVPAYLKLRLRANEIIVTLMMNYIGILILEYMVYGPWKDPMSFGFPMTREFSPNAILGRIGTGNLHWGIAICVACGFAVWIFFRFSRTGFEFKISGQNRRAALYAHLPYGRLVILAMILSGGLAGLAAFLEASVTINRLQPSIIAGYGYTAIVVAWLAQLNPLNIGLASFLLAGLRIGVENLQLELQVPASFGQIMEGMILLAVLGGGFFTRYRLHIQRRRS